MKKKFELKYVKCKVTREKNSANFVKKKEKASQSGVRDWNENKNIHGAEWRTVKVVGARILTLNFDAPQKCGRKSSGYDFSCILGR